MRANEYRFFIKYLASYLVILLIPITVLTLVVNNVFVNKLQDEVISGNLNSLDKVRYLMDDQLKWIDDMTHQLLTEDNSLTQYRISDHWGYKAWGITRELKRFQRLSPFIHEIWLYYKDENAVFTSNGIYSIPVLAKQIYTFDDLSETQLVAHLQDLQSPAVLPTKKDEISGDNYVRMFVPLFPTKNQSEGTLVYLIEEEAVHRLMSAYHTAAGSAWMFDQTNQLVTGMTSANGPSEESVARLITQSPLEDYQQVMMDGSQYYMFSMQSEQSGWKYVTLLPVNEVMARVSQAQEWYIYGVIALALLGGAAIYIGMRMNYKPIYQLRRDSIQVLANRARNRNELDTVRDALNHLAHHNKELDERVKNRALAARSHLFLSLLKGEYEETEDMLEYGQEIGFPIALANHKVRIMIVQLPAHSDTKRAPSIEAMCRLFPDTCSVFGIEHMEPGKYVVMMARVEGGDSETEVCLQAFRDTLSQTLQAPVTVGVGSEVVISDIPKSYLEAQTAIGYRFVQGVNRVIDYERIPLHSCPQVEYPHSEMAGLQSAIREGDTNKIQGHLALIVTFIKEIQPPLIVARGLCFEMIRLINGVWRELGLQEEHGPERYPNIFALERLETIDEFENLIHTISSDLCSAFENQQVLGTKEAALDARSIESIMDYIQAHADRCEFTLQGMAEHFGVALPNLGQFFKDRTGQTLLEYTTSLRMEKAKVLLTSTSLQLKAVAEEVGYNNVSSFIRRFKQLTGVTPGEYRSIRLESDSSLSNEGDIMQL
ncbi:AraC-like DNA-binding protein [Paenibacillus phyllosphaerae]|uniref:AraC-like DNA-binding protein n=1 Tax=Paenibacillus phyllosphaerae TaxID=274593 RepID=A0A7W5FQK0_9BACL|nr:helix-turn-helix domain-containing protein [Paenibacillus phyllosphaerae]MBB3113368.1 AraC-like DNA-binding protein [Paenibacillus phyllosphaerae]